MAKVPALCAFTLLGKPCSSRPEEEEKGLGFSCSRMHLITTDLRGHMERQEMEMKRKLEMKAGNGNWKLKTEMETDLLAVVIVLTRFWFSFLGTPVLSTASSFRLVALLA